MSVSQVVVADKRVRNTISRLTPPIATSTAALAPILSLVASVGPGLIASRLRPIEALRYE